MARKLKQRPLPRATPKNQHPSQRQVGGSHYKADIQHWDYVLAQPWGVGYFKGQIGKYVERYDKKNGIQDLEKAEHFLAKLLAFERAKLAGAASPALAAAGWQAKRG